MADSIDATRQRWDRQGLRHAILEALGNSGHDLGRLTIADLAPLDQFHAGGLGFTRRLARLAGFVPGMQVLDVGGGLGGPARTLAVEFGCRVTVVDLAESYIDAGRALTSLMRLDDRVTLQVGDATSLEFGNGTFDAVWTQNSGMNIADKDQLYAELHRVLKPLGVLATQEPMAGPGGPRTYPLMWADDPVTDHLRTPAEMRAVIEDAGFRMLAWDEVRVDRSAAGTPPPPYTIQRLVMGDEQIGRIMQASKVNERERRTVMTQAVFAADRLA